MPNTGSLGLAEAGVKLGAKGEVLVDEFSRTNVPSIWAVGDVTDRIQVRGSCRAASGQLLGHCRTAGRLGQGEAQPCSEPVTED